MNTEKCYGVDSIPRRVDKQPLGKECDSAEEVTFVTHNPIDLDKISPIM